MNDDRHGTTLASRPPDGTARRVALLACAGAAIALAAARGAELDGSARVAWTESDTETATVATTEQSVHLGLTQILTPYLRLRVSESYADLSSTLDGADVFSRSNEQPRVELLYGRPNLTARVGYDLARTRSDVEADRFDASSVTGSLAWRTRVGLRLGLSLREATNRGDVAALGRDVDDRRARLDLAFDRGHWSVGYSAAYGELERVSTGLAVEQLRHDLRFSGARDWLAGRLHIGVNALAGRLESQQRRGEGDLGEPLPAVAGLATIDASPETATLDAAPGLVDGEVGEATTPPIEIGGANTFRNVGVDLGLSLPATRLEIHVDRPSGAGLGWRVYHSADNLFWEPIPAVTGEFDATLLRYSLRFAPVTDRYFKAVNVTINPAELVRVTEVRALREITAILGADDSSSDLYRAGVSLGWQIAPRVQLSLGADTSNDETTFGAVTRRDYTTSSARGGLTVDMSRDLRLVVGYRWLDSEDRRVGGIQRSTEEVSASLRWDPLPTVDAVLALATRDELDAGELLSTSTTSRLSVSLRLLEELRLVSELLLSRLDSRLLGVERDTVHWTQRFETEPYEHWRFDGGYTWSRTESGVDGQPLLERTSFFATVYWSPGAALAFHGSLIYYDDSVGASLRQSYGLSWVPGPKLTFSLAWNEFEEQRGQLTGGGSLAVNYHLASRAQLFATLTESRTELADGTRERVTTAHAGTAVSF